MTVPRTLAVVLNPASGFEKAESTTSLRGTKQSRKHVPRHCEERSNPEITGLQERQDLQVFIRIASFLAMTNALHVNALAMTWYH
ncbi:MAG: hypothetical protein LBD53_06535 [Tannerella sp.]|jgi:hypothetical protein|nr:hypothetical protein [Tannerella sp.]